MTSFFAKKFTWRQDIRQILNIIRISFLMADSWFLSEYKNWAEDIWQHDWLPSSIEFRSNQMDWNDTILRICLSVMWVCASPSFSIILFSSLKSMNESPSSSNLEMFRKDIRTINGCMNCKILMKSANCLVEAIWKEFKLIKSIIVIIKIVNFYLCMTTEIKS